MGEPQRAAEEEPSMDLTSAPPRFNPDVPSERFSPAEASVDYDCFDVLNNNAADDYERDAGGLRDPALASLYDKIEKSRKFDARERIRSSKSNRESLFKYKTAYMHANVTKPVKPQPSPKDLGTKIKNNKEPLPMKLRALPRSFWQQPNQPPVHSPAPALPPLTLGPAQRLEDPQASQNVAPEANRMAVVSNANTELLFSLFRSVESTKKSSAQKRGRPKKVHPTCRVGVVRDDDPCLLSSGLLPALTPSRPQPDHPKSVNYSQILNELVFQL